MKETEMTDNQDESMEAQLVGVNAKTGPYVTARSWSGGRRRILGKGALESYTYHVMSRIPQSPE
jgi:putative transposase